MSRPSARQGRGRVQSYTALGRCFADDMTSVSSDLASYLAAPLVVLGDRYGTGVDRSLADRLTTHRNAVSTGCMAGVPQVQAGRCVLYSSALYRGQTVADSDQCVYMFRVIAWSDEVLPSP